MFVTLKKINLFILLILVYTIIGCSHINIKYSKPVIESLELSGDNRYELEFVLNHYYSGNDTLKAKAAEFLIGNMKYNYSYIELPFARGVFDSIASIKISADKKFNIWQRRELFRKMLDSASKDNKIRKSLVCDLKLVKSNFLINDIDLAFYAWRKIPVGYRVSFNDFCIYILPYKNSNEPLESNARRNLYEKYKWVIDSLNFSKNKENVIDAVIDSLHFQTADNIRKKYPATLTVSQVEKSRLGICQDGVNYLVNAFRAIGIKCSEDYVPHWGNHHSSGHSWISIQYGKETYVKDSSPQLANNSYADLKKLYRQESIPKVYRLLFSPTRIDNEVSVHLDVTKWYTDTYNPIINIITNGFIKNIKPKICVFNKKRQWVPVDDGQISNGKAKFYNIGKQSIYLACFVDEHVIRPLNYPFFFDNNTCSPHFLKPSLILEDSVPLLRKYPIARRNIRILDWIKHLNGAKIQGSQDSLFRNPIELCVINNISSSQPKRILISVDKKFSFVRFYSEHNNCYVSELSFFNKNGKLLRGSTIKSNPSWTDSLNDNKPWTSFGGRNAFIGLHLPHPEAIGSIKIQARSDGNHIRIGSKYELLYWKDTWISLGKKVAYDTILYYNKVPKNSLLLLKNRTEGKEEHVFILDKRKRQKWIGSI